MVCALLATAVSLGQTAGWTSQTALQRLKPDTTVVIAEVWDYVRALQHEDPSVRLAAVEYWAVMADEVQADYSDWIEDQPKTPETVVEWGGDPFERPTGPVIDFLATVAGYLDMAAADKNEAVSRAALRTMCALGYDVHSISPPGPSCGTGAEYFWGYHVVPLLKHRAKGRDGELLALVDDQNIHVAYSALCLLDWNHREALRPKLLEMLKSDGELARCVGIHFLLHESSEDLIKVIGPLLEDPSDNVRMSASYQFQWSFVYRDFPTMIAKWDTFSPAVRAEIVELAWRSEPEDKLSHAMRGLNDRAGIVREKAMVLLGEIDEGPPPLTEAQLRSLVRDPHGPVRAMALASLFETKPEDARVLAITALTDPHVKVREEGADYFGENFDLEMTPLIVRAAEMGLDWDFGTVKYFTHPENSHYFSVWLSSPNPNLRRSVVGAVSYGDVLPQNLDQLLALAKLERDPDVIDELVYALGDLKDQRVGPALLAMSRHADGMALDHLVYRLRDFPSPEVRAYLTELAKSPNKELRRSAKNVLKSQAS